jgi:hypothetical protein
VARGFQLGRSRQRVVWRAAGFPSRLPNQNQNCVRMAGTIQHRIQNPP